MYVSYFIRDPLDLVDPLGLRWVEVKLKLTLKQTCQNHMIHRLNAYFSSQGRPGVPLSFVSTVVIVDFIVSDNPVQTYG